MQKHVDDDDDYKVNDDDGLSNMFSMLLDFELDSWEETTTTTRWVH